MECRFVIGCMNNFPNFHHHHLGPETFFVASAPSRSCPASSSYGNSGPWRSAGHDFVSRCADKKSGRQQRKKLVFEGTKQIWRCLCVVVLNGMSQGWQLLPCTRGRLSGNQKAAMGVINMWIELFCQQPQQVVQLPCFPDLVKNRQLDYTGEELVTALPLRLEELRPGLPDKGVAGSLSAVTAAAGFVQAWVADPWLTLKPEGMWPSKTPRARINATRDDGTGFVRSCMIGA